MPLESRSISDGWMGFLTTQRHLTQLGPRNFMAAILFPFMPHVFGALEMSPGLRLRPVDVAEKRLGVDCAIGHLHEFMNSPYSNR